MEDAKIDGTPKFEGGVRPKRRTWHIAFDGMRYGSQAMGALQYTTGPQGLTTEHLRGIADYVREHDRFESCRISFFGELFD